MQIIPVIDIRNGFAVRAIAGDRGRYQPLKTRLTESVEPAEILKALQREYDCGVGYVADLDGIERSYINRCVLGEMARTGVRLMVDAGVSSPNDAEQILELGASSVIVSSESLSDIDQLPNYLQQCGAASVVFSIDLKHGRLMAAHSQWMNRSPLDLICRVVEHGVRQIIVLDLAVVGTGTGIPTLALCREIKQRWPDLNLVSGGGVNCSACISAATNAGLDGLLIASALHDGRLNVQDIEIV